MRHSEGQGKGAGAAAIEARLRALAVREGMTLARFATVARTRAGPGARA